MWVKDVTDFLRFCHLNIIPCFFSFLSSSSDEFTQKQENSKTDVSVGVRQPYFVPLKGIPTWRLHTNLINLGKTFSRISRI